MINVLHISTPMSWRGGEQQLAYLAEELKEKVEQFFICRTGSEMELFCFENEFTCFSIPTSVLKIFENAALIKRICKNYKIDVIHTHDSKAHTLAFVASTLGNKTPIVVSRKVDFPIAQSYLSKKKYNSTNIARLIAVSEEVKNIVQKGIEKPEKITVIYDGVDTKWESGIKPDLYDRFEIERGKKIIGNVSALAPHKDYFTWVDTAEKLLSKRQDLHFLIIGLGPMQAKIAAYIKQKGLENAISMTGFIPNAKTLIAGFNVFFMSSETEGLGSSILDAFVRKVPVVATSAGGIPEIVKNEETGLLASPKDAQGLADAIERILADQVLREHIIRNAEQWVQNFDYRKMAAKTLEIYQNVRKSK